MTSIDSLFGNYLNKNDIVKDTQVKVKEVKVELVGQDQEKKAVLYFESLDKGLTVNRTNGDTIAEITGTREVEGWVGSEFILFFEPTVIYAGKKTGGIRIKPLVEVSKQVHK